MDELPEWFKGARLNYAENLLRYNDDKTALIETGEHGLINKISWRQLCTRVQQCANALRRHGIKAGDRVAGYIPNSPDAVVAMLATTSIGAIWSSASPDFGTTVRFYCASMHDTRVF